MRCGECGFEAKTKAGLSAHQRSRHPTREPRMGVHGAVMSGNRIEVLRALQRRLARDLDSQDLESRDLAPLSRQLAAVTRELNEVAPKEHSVVDDLAARRSRRRAAASDK